MITSFSIKRHLETLMNMKLEHSPLWSYLQRGKHVDSNEFPGTQSQFVLQQSLRKTMCTKTTLTERRFSRSSNSILTKERPIFSFIFCFYFPLPGEAYKCSSFFLSGEQDNKNN